jgi:acetoacetyl-CoA reductase
MRGVTLVTGGTRGIGKAISIKLKEVGFNVAASFSGNVEAAEKFNSETGIPVYKWSIESPEQCELGVRKIENDLGEISVLVNNAGITRDTMFHKMTPTMWHEVIDTNVHGLFNMTHPVWQKMREKGYGRIINISSINGQKGQMGQVNYSSSKSATIGFTKALALEGASKGITVNAVCPGYVETDMVNAMSKEAIDKTVAQIPVGRLGSPEDIARCVHFLASENAGFITGSTVTANGGQFIF